MVVEKIQLTWGPRKQSLNEVMNSLSIFLSKMGKLDSFFESWYIKESSENFSEKQKLSVSSEGLKKSVVRIDKDYDEVGFTFGMWTGYEEDDYNASISGSVGSWDKSLKNNFLLRFPVLGDKILSKESDEFREIKKILLDTWAPDKIKVGTLT